MYGKLIRLLTMTSVLLGASVMPSWADASSRLTDFAIQKLNSTFDTVSKAMPTVTKYVLDVTSMNCLVNILQGLVMLIISGIMGYTALRLLKYGEEGYTDNHGFSTIGGVFLSLVCIVSLFISITGIMDFWSWVGIFHPDLYLIHLTIQKVVH